MNLADKEKKEWLYTLIWGIAATVFVTLAAMLYLDFPHRDFNVFYVAGGGDGCLFMSTIKNLKENGLMGQFFCDRTGAPETSAWIETPFFDMFHIFQLWFLAKITPTIDFAAYVDFILTYTLAGITMFILLRSLNIKNWYNFVFTVVFVLAPAHYWRGMAHISVSHYFTVPLAILLGIYIFETDTDRSKANIILLAVSSFLVGLGYQYYTFFAVIIWVPAYFAYAVKLISRKCKSVKIYAKKLWPFAITCGTLFLTRLPSIIYSLMNGKNATGIQRQPLESELYGMKIIQLFVPSVYTRSSFLQNMRDKYNLNAFNVNENMIAALGLIASAGLIMIVAWFFVMFVYRKKEFAVFDYLSFAAITMVLVCTTGGIGAIFNYVVSSQLRCYNRGSIVIACLSLTFFAIVINKIKLEKKVYNTVLTVVIGFAFLGVCYYDQVPAAMSQSEEEIMMNNAYAFYFRKIEDVMPEGAMIYQLPYVLYPENPPVVDMIDYAHLKGYIYTDTLKWSYGGIKGRNERARELNIDNGISDLFVRSILEAGFSGVYIDTKGYSDGGAEIIRFYDSYGITPIVSDGGELYFYDLRDVNVDETHLIPGYRFAKKFAHGIGYEAADEDIVRLAGLLYEDEAEAVEVMYNWIEATDTVNMDNNGYIVLMSTYVLGRSPDSMADAYWVEEMKKGRSKHDVLYAFVISEESHAFGGR